METLVRSEKTPATQLGFRQIEEIKTQLDLVASNLAGQMADLQATNDELAHKVKYLSDTVENLSGELAKAQQKEFANRKRFLEAVKKVGEITSATVAQAEMIRRESREQLARKYEEARLRAEKVAPVSRHEAQEMMAKIKYESMRSYQETEAQVLSALEKARLETLSLLDDPDIEGQEHVICGLDLEHDGTTEVSIVLEESPTIPAKTENNTIMMRRKVDWQKNTGYEAEGSSRDLA